MSKLKFGDKHIHLPRSKPIRIIIGIVLILLGFVGFLPIIGFWMIPLGLLVLSEDIPLIRRARRRVATWWGRRKQRRADKKAEKQADQHEGDVDC